MRVLIVGCGQVGRRVGREWRRRGVAVTGLVRRPEAATALSEAGITVVVTDLDEGAVPPPADLLYYFAPPPAAGEGDPRIDGFLDALTETPRRLVYVSTSGVYGDRRGAWVTEADALNPGTARARRRAAAESRLAEWAAANGSAVVVLRVPAIYSRARLPLARIRAGEPVVREDESPYGNRIHEQDLMRICTLLGEDGAPGGVFNVSDGRPTTMTAYFNAVADHFCLPRPPQIGLEEARRRLSPAMFSFWAESRRLDIGRLTREAGFEPLYPTVERGLSAD